MYEKIEIQMPYSKEAFESAGAAEAIRVGNLIYVSGQTGWRSDVAVQDELYPQAALAFQRLDKILNAAGASARHVVHLQIFLVIREAGTMGEAIEIAFKAKNEVVPECRAAATAVQVAGLFDPAILIEVQAVAVAE